MLRRPRVLSLIAALLLLLTVQLAREAYRWYAFSEERASLLRLTGDLEDVAVDVVRSQLRVDSVRVLIEAEDSVLGEAREEIARIERQGGDGLVPAHQYDRYRSMLRQYNERVQERNRRLDDWQRLVRDNRGAVNRYNVLADSIRYVADRMGEPYYRIPSPAEVAATRGILPAPPL